MTSTSSQGFLSPRSVNELKSRVAAELVNNGKLDKLRAQLREYIYEAINAPNTNANSQAHANTTNNRLFNDLSVSEDYINGIELIRDFLEFYSLSHSLSVLTAEANLYKYNAQSSTSTGTASTGESKFLIKEKKVLAAHLQIPAANNKPLLIELLHKNKSFGQNMGHFNQISSSNTGLVSPVLGAGNSSAFSPPNTSSNSPKPKQTLLSNNSSNNQAQQHNPVAFTSLSPTNVASSSDKVNLEIVKPKLRHPVSNSSNSNPLSGSWANSNAATANAVKPSAINSSTNSHIGRSIVNSAASADNSYAEDFEEESLDMSEASLKSPSTQSPLAAKASLLAVDNQRNNRRKRGDFDFDSVKPNLNISALSRLDNTESISPASKSPRNHKGKVVAPTATAAAKPNSANSALSTAYNNISIKPPAVSNLSDDSLEEASSYSLSSTTDLETEEQRQNRLAEIDRILSGVSNKGNNNKKAPIQASVATSSVKRLQQHSASEESIEDKAAAKNQSFADDMAEDIDISLEGNSAGSIEQRGEDSLDQQYFNSSQDLLDTAAKANGAANHKKNHGIAAATASKLASLQSQVAQDLYSFDRTSSGGEFELEFDYVEAVEK
jgi:hypothetical protein